MDEEGGYPFSNNPTMLSNQKHVLHLSNIRGLAHDSIMLLSTCFQACTVCKYGFVLKMHYDLVSQTVLPLEFLLNVLALKWDVDVAEKSMCAL